MKTLNELYEQILKEKKLPDKGQNYNPVHLDCLLHPEKYAPVIYEKPCTAKECSRDNACRASCIFDAIEKGDNGELRINADLCTGCGVCLEACQMKKITFTKDALAAMKAVREKKGQAYALIAPAFSGQFSQDVTPGRLRTAFKALGFTGMVEVALFADILTLKEALEFDEHIKKKGDFQLTSCCCPIWISMIRKIYCELMPHVPGAVSPMIACGRMIKMLHPDAVTVFVGPCMAKKKEAREPDIADAVDYVLTFQEVQDIFDAADIHPEMLEDSQKDHSSRAGRIYARTGGVSEAVRETVNRLSPDRRIRVKAEQADGILACREIIERLRKGVMDANFFEGMGCQGGCVGGPKILIDKEKGRENVELYGKEAMYETPLENPYVLELLKRLGFETVQDLIENSGILERDFSKG